jgi:hypothetical protein
MWMAPVFPQVNALPRSERQLARSERNAQIHRRQCRPHVGRHVIFAFSGVAEQGIAIRSQPRKKTLQIAAHFRIGVLLDQERRGSVLQMQRDQSILQLRFLQEFENLFGEVVKASSPRGDLDLVDDLLHSTQGTLKRWTVKTETVMNDECRMSKKVRIAFNVLTLLTIFNVAGAAQSFDFALIGDTPYTDEATTNAFPNLIEELNAARLAFVVHDGDIKSGGTPCTDALFEERYRQFQTIKHPLIYVFGDNEWQDCGGNRTNKFNADERLEKLRQTFTVGDQSLGRRTLRLTRQSEQTNFVAFRENVRWIYRNILFAAMNLPGDGNNFGKREFAARHAANMAWMNESFDLAEKQGHRAVMLIIQANPHFDLGATNKVRAGFNEFLKELERRTIAFQKPVVLVHGDSHYFRIDKPMVSSRSKRRVENFTRVETFGYPDVHWIRVRVRADNPDVFDFYPQIVRKNLIDHRGAN